MKEAYVTKGIHYNIPFTYKMFRIGKSTETEGRLVFSKAEGREHCGATETQHRLSFGGEENVQELVMMVSRLHEYTNSH